MNIYIFFKQETEHYKQFFISRKKLEFLALVVALLLFI